MPILLPWTSTRLDDLDALAPTTPCLFVYTWYLDDLPDSAVTRFWQDEATGAIQSELLQNAPVTYDEAVGWALEQATVHRIERIHVWDARTAAPGHSTKRKAQGTSKPQTPSPMYRRVAKRNAVTPTRRRRRASRLPSSV